MSRLGRNFEPRFPRGFVLQGDKGVTSNVTSGIPAVF